MIPIEVKGDQLLELLNENIPVGIQDWIAEKKEKIVSSASAKELYLTYSLLAGKIANSEVLSLPEEGNAITAYLEMHEATTLELARIYLLVCVLEENNVYFSPKVANLIQVADTSELETFLKFLSFLPNAEDFKSPAVDALRTNISTVFDAISCKNPYPSSYFNDQQWNQMYLKAAFMQRDLSEILDVDKKANEDLARIISDYAHERWAASRDVDPLFWRPVSKFLNEILLKDMRRLLSSSKVKENMAGALCCYHSDSSEAMGLLNAYPELKEQVESGAIRWESIKN